MCEGIEVLSGNAHALPLVPAKHEYSVGTTSHTVADRRGLGVDDRT